MRDNAVVERVLAGFITLSGGGLANAPYTMASGDPSVNIQSLEFSLIISAPEEKFLNLSMDSRHSRYFRKIVDSAYMEVRLPDQPSAAKPPDNLPKEIVKTNLMGGTADDLNAINTTHYTNSIDALKCVQDVNIVCAPDATEAGVALKEHCETMRNRFRDSGCATRGGAFRRRKRHLPPVRSRV